eukprot:1012517-Rhodomonas_salina.1
MHCRGRRLSPGDVGKGATAITVGGVCAIPNASSGTMLDWGQQLSPSGGLHGYLSPATGFKFRHLPVNHRAFHSLCCLAAWPSTALSCVHDTHSGWLPSFFARVLCCVLSSLG